MLLPIATTSEVPYIHNPLNPPMGPIVLSYRFAVDERIAIPDPCSAPEMVLRDAEILAWS